MIYQTWALNEATVEKASRERMLEVVIEIDGRPLSTFGCDGVVISTPTARPRTTSRRGGRSSGRPSRRWPSCRCRRTRSSPSRSWWGPEASVAIEVLERTNGTGILWCDGRRSHELPPGARVVVRRSELPVRLARLHPAAFTDRLVRKFRLPVEGWRGPRGLRRHPARPPSRRPA